MEVLFFGVILIKWGVRYFFVHNIFLLLFVFTHQHRTFLSMSFKKEKVK